LARKETTGMTAIATMRLLTEILVIKCLKLKVRDAEGNIADLNLIAVPPAGHLGTTGKPFALYVA
jgi:hypothetical protein